MRTPLLIANWKMHKTNAETSQFVQELQQQHWPPDRQIVICAPFTALATLQEQLQHSAIGYGAQTMHWETKGAYTGEISAPMLLELGCHYVIIGHSERRRDHNETDATVQKKVATALHFGLIPIICVGETLTQRKANQTISLLKQQLTTTLINLAPKQLNKIVVAYEPIWAIGTGIAAPVEQAQTVHSFIRTLVTNQTKIIYGGSVNSKNITSLMAQPDIDGVLVGNASLAVSSFTQLLNYQEII